MEELKKKWKQYMDTKKRIIDLEKQIRMLEKERRLIEEIITRILRDQP